MRNRIILNKNKSKRGVFIAILLNECNLFILYLYYIHIIYLLIFCIVLYFNIFRLYFRSFMILCNFFPIFYTFLTLFSFLFVLTVLFQCNCIVLNVFTSLLGITTFLNVIHFYFSFIFFFFFFFWLDNSPWSLYSRLCIWPNDGTSHQGWEDVIGKIGSSKATLDKLQTLCEKMSSEWCKK